MKIRTSLTYKNGVLDNNSMLHYVYKTYKHVKTSGSGSMQPAKHTTIID